MPRGTFKGIIHVGFKDVREFGNMGLEWSIDRCRVSFRVGTELILPNHIRQEETGWIVQVNVVGNDGRKVIYTTDMLLRYGWYNGEGHRMVIRNVE